MPARRRVLGWAALLTVLVCWWFTLAPAVIGGPASYVVVLGTSMEPRWQTGDIVVTRATGSYEVGDVISFRTPDGMVIHRITGGDGTSGFTTQGDNRASADGWSTQDSDVVGEEWATLPISVDTLLRWGPWTAALLTFLLVAWPSRKRPEAGSAAEPDDQTPTETEQDGEPACAVPSR